MMSLVAHALDQVSQAALREVVAVTCGSSYGALC